MNELAKALEGGGDAPEASPPILAKHGGPAGAADPAAVESVRSTHGGARKGAGRPRGRPKKAAEPEPAPAVMDLAPLMPVVVDTYAMVLSLLAAAVVVFDDAERPAVSGGLEFVITHYLPADAAKHAPVIVLAAVSVKAMGRAKEEKRARAEKAKADDERG